MPGGGKHDTPNLSALSKKKQTKTKKNSKGKSLLIADDSLGKQQKTEHDFRVGNSSLLQTMKYKHFWQQGWLSLKALLGQAHLVQCRACQTFPYLPNHLSVPGQDKHCSAFNAGLSLASPLCPGCWARLFFILSAQLCSVLCRHSLMAPSQDDFS